MVNKTKIIFEWKKISNWFKCGKKFIDFSNPNQTVCKKGLGGLYKLKLMVGEKRDIKLEGFIKNL